jgi:hypothetical protein
MHLGKDKQAILLAVFLAYTASASGQAGKSFKFHLDGNLQNSNVIAENQSIIINYSISELDALSLTNSTGAFYRISIPEHISSAIPGRPELPVFSRLISVPDGSEYTIKITEVRSSRIKPSSEKIEGRLFPAQENETKEGSVTKTQFKFDKAVYATRGYIPSDTVIIEPLGIARKNKLANLYISPVRYNPQSNSLEVITSMKIEITFTYPAVTATKSATTRSVLFEESFNNSILNFNPDNVIPGYSDQPVKMVIITDTAFKKQLEPFIKWKTQKGFKLKILYKGTGLAGNTYTQLKDTLTKIYNASSTNDPPPEYLLIIGDINRVPYYGFGGSGNVTDLYYGEFDGNGDYIPEMFIGRLPVADTTELKTTLGKIIQYEKFQYVDTNKFYSQSIVSAGYDESGANYMNGQVKYAITNYLTTSNNTNEHHFYYPQCYTAKDSIIKLINNGVSFINYTGHGDALGWLHLNIKSSDIISFKNKNMYPFVISNACRTSQFSNSNSFGNKMVLSSEKGAIGFIGCSNDTFWNEDFHWAVGSGTISSDPIYDGSHLGAYDRMFHTHGESPSDWYFTMGQINYAGNLSVSATNSSNKKYYWEAYNLVGDPSVIPIIGKPGSFKVSLPDTLPNGIKSLSLSVDPFAYVAISHFDTLWDAAYASNTGTVVLDMPGLSDDSCLLVITGQNKIPVLKTIYFSDINKEFINLTASSINDINGNNNSMADYGESVYLKLTISNLGLTEATNLYAKISSSSNLINITNDSVSIGTLAAKSNTVLSDKLGFSISNNVPDRSIINIQLILKDKLYEKHYSVDICVHAPELQIVNFVLNDATVGNGDNIADPGETFRLVFKVSNQGTSDISGQFGISSGNSEISIVESSVKSGVLKFGEITEIPVLVKLSKSASSGDLITVSANLECGSFIINKDFSFKVGKIRESFEVSSFNIFPWINISQVPWIITPTDSFDGLHSARSGAIGNNASTSLKIKTVYSQADSLRFYYRVSSEADYDLLIFRLNGQDILKKSGEIPWTKEVVEVPEGLNILEWIYKKDVSQTGGSDCARIDMIDFTGSALVSYVQRDLEIARMVTPVEKDPFGQGTVTVKVLNTGKDTINGFNLAYQINNRWPPTREFFKNKVIPFGDSVTVSFKTKTDLSKRGVYDILTYAYDNNDDYLLNDTLQLDINNNDISDSLRIYPNPFIDQFTIYMNSRIDDKIQFSLFNMLGEKIYTFEKDIIAGKNSIDFPVIKLIPATYYLNMHGRIFNKTVPVIKIRN